MLGTLFGLVGLVVAVFVIWRLFSQRRSLPCPSWLGWMVERDNPFTKTNRAAVFSDHLGLSSGMSVLDPGCGPGRLTLPLAKAVASKGTVCALDLQQGMLDSVREKVDAAGLHNVHYLHAGFGEGKLGKSIYDRTVLVTVLGEVVDPVSALREIYDSLKPGGIFSVTEVIFDPHFQSRKKGASLSQRGGVSGRRVF